MIEVDESRTLLDTVVDAAVVTAQERGMSGRRIWLPPLPPVVELAGVFVALGVAGSTALARKIGAAVENDRIVTDEKMQTTVPGLYAAGDCTGGLLQVAKAVYEGALAGTEAAKALRKG